METGIEEKNAEGKLKNHSKSLWLFMTCFCAIFTFNFFGFTLALVHGKGNLEFFHWMNMEGWLLCFFIPLTVIGLIFTIAYYALYKGYDPEAMEQKSLEK